MSNQSYKFGSQGGTFMGAHFAMEDPFVLTANIKRNYIHALLHFAHTEKHLYYTVGMSYEDCFAGNQDFFNQLCATIKDKHKYTVSINELQQAVKDFVRRMEHIHKT